MSDILILHGWGSCAKNWAKIKQLLEFYGHSVYVPDLPGFGDNPPPSNVWLIDDYVEWVKNYCQKQKLFCDKTSFKWVLKKEGQERTECLREQFFLLGHSFGGSIAIKFALKYPAKIKKLFLVGPAIIRKKTLKKEIIKKTAKTFSFLPLRIKKIIYGKIIKSDYPLQVGIMREIYLKVIEENLLSLLPAISIPTVIIWGQKDKITPLSDGYLIKKQLPNSELKIVPGVGHSLHYQSPEELVKIVVSSL